MTRDVEKQLEEMKNVDAKHASAITSELKSQIDKIWSVFWSNGISNPLVVMEQMSYLLFIRQLDILDIQHDKPNHIRWSVIVEESDDRTMFEKNSHKNFEDCENNW